MAPKRKKLTKTETIVQWTEAELNGKDRAQLQTAYKTLKTTYGKRKKAFQKEGEFSYAIDRYEREMKKSPKIPVKNMTINRLRREVAMLQHMFRGETSTLAGAEEAYREQDIRIFGAVPGTNIPNFRMSAEAREAYWNAYDEWRSDERIQGLHMGSSQEQSNLADIMFGGGVKKKFFFDNLDGTVEGEEYVRFADLSKAEQGTALYNYLKNIKDVKERAEFMPNVYTGRGSNFKP